MGLSGSGSRAATGQPVCPLELSRRSIGVRRVRGGCRPGPAARGSRDQTVRGPSPRRARCPRRRAVPRLGVGRVRRTCEKPCGSTMPSPAVPDTLTGSPRCRTRGAVVRGPCSDHDVGRRGGRPARGRRNRSTRSCHTENCRCITKPPAPEHTPEQCTPRAHCATRRPAAVASRLSGAPSSRERRRASRKK